MNTFEQGLLKYLTEDQLSLIQSKKVGIGGAGGLGSNVAMILVRSGFKNIEVLDLDVIDASNLNRQQFFTSEIGQEKSKTLAIRLKQINPDLNITAHTTTWTKDTADKFFNDCDYYVEAFDKADAKFNFVEYYQRNNKPIVSGSGMAGLKTKNPMTLKKIGNIYMIGDQT
ncbi:MAG: sulfur carrier protein ThiS adenylyltransferase, partial [Candidatus Omnitrophota bacterium]